MTTASLDGVSDLYMMSHTLGEDLALQVRSLTTSPLNPTPGSSVTLTVKAMNLGDRGVSDVPVAFYLGDPAAGIKVGEVVIAGTFAPGETRDVSLAWVAPVFTTSRTITAVIDPLAAHDPINRSNNLDSTVIAQPDLTVASLRWDKLSENLVSVTGRVTNEGIISAGASSVSFYRNAVSGTLLGTAFVPALLPGESADVQLLWDITALHEMFYKVAMASDVGDVIAELDEGNNSGSVIMPGRYEDMLVTLTVTKTGTGGGSFISTPLGIACNTNCEGRFVWGTPIKLTAAASEYSIFSGWSNGCSGTGTCTLVITEPAMVTASFDKDTSHAVRWDVPYTRHFSTLIEAYTSAISPVTIKTWGTELDGDVTFNANKKITILGGYNSDYSATTGRTILRGKLTIQGGSLRVNGLVVRKAGATSS